MAYEIQWSENAAREYACLDNSVKIQIDKFLEKLKTRDDPATLGKPLTANLGGLWRYRVGDYRIVAEIKSSVLTILILSIKHRSIVYREKG
jgi:mRNA interferase RelE/StbE